MSLEKLKEEIAAMPEEARKQFIESWGEPQELDPELQLYEVDLGQTGKWVKHPICFSPMHIPHLNAIVNKQFAAKKDLLQTFVDKEDWYGVVLVVYERPYRLQAFLKYEERMTEEQYWDILGSIWTDSENIWQNEDEWQMCFTINRPNRVRFLMEPEEREVFESLPDEITVYRGYAIDGRDNGMSWTLDKERAEWFAKRFVHRDEEIPRLVQGTVLKEHVLAYFGARQESEIVVFPAWVENRQETKL